MPRLPELFDRNALAEGDRDAHDYLVKTRGRVSNGFAPFLHSPEVVRRVAHLGTFMRFDSSVPAKMRELLALTASSELDNAYERTIHAGDAVKQGASQAAVDAAVNKTGLDGLPEDEALAITVAREIVLGNHHLSDATFQKLHRLVGDRTFVEVIGTVGYYSMLAFNHNAMEVTLPS